MNIWIINLILVLVYILIAVLSCRSDNKFFKQLYSCGRIGVDPKAGKYMYAYRDDKGEEKWVAKVD